MVVFSSFGIVVVFLFRMLWCFSRKPCYDFSFLYVIGFIGCIFPTVELAASPKPIENARAQGRCNPLKGKMHFHGSDIRLYAYAYIYIYRSSNYSSCYIIILAPL